MLTNTDKGMDRICDRCGKSLLSNKGGGFTTCDKSWCGAELCLGECRDAHAKEVHSE